MSKKKAKILITGCDNFGSGGRSIMGYRMTEPLIGKYQFDFLTFGEKKKTNWIKKISSNGGEVVFVKSDDETIGMMAHIYRLYSIYEIIKENKYDIVYANVDDVFEALRIIVLSKLAKTNNIIIHGHGSENMNQQNFIGNQIIKITRKYVLKNSTDKIACSKVAATLLYGEDDSNVKYISNGISFDDFFYDEAKRLEMRKQYRVAGNEKVVLYVGRFSEGKRPLLAIKICQQLTTKYPVKLIMVGSGEEERKIQKYIIENKLQNVVKLVGQQDDVNSFYSMADILLFPSEHESFGLVLLEALATGINCVVSSAIPKELIINRQVGVVENNASVSCWCKMICQFLDKTQNRECAMLENKKILKKRGFDISKAAAQLDKVYENIISRRE